MRKPPPPYVVANETFYFSWHAVGEAMRAARINDMQAVDIQLDLFMRVLKTFEEPTDGPQT